MNYRNSFRCAFVSICAAVACVCPLYAGDGVWIGVPSGGSYAVDWSDPATWENGVIANGVGATATFRPDTSYIQCIFDTPVNIGHLVFEKASDSCRYRLEDDDDMRLLFQTTNGTPSITVDRRVSVDFRFPLGGTQGLDISGEGSMSFIYGSTLTGVTTIYSGSLEVWDDNALGATGAGNGTIVHNGGNLSIGANKTINDSLSISGTGSYYASGALRLFGEGKYAGPITLTGDATIAQEEYWDVAHGKITGPVSLGSADVTFQMNREYCPNDYTADTFRTSVSGTISGTGGVIVTGEGTLTLSGANTYSGGNTVLNEAVLRVSSDANLGAASNGVILDGGVLQVAGTGFTTTSRDFEILNGDGVIDVDSAGTSFVISSSLTGVGDLIKDGDGILSLTANNEDFTGNFIITDGTLAVGIGDSVGSQTSIIVKDGAKLKLQGPEDIGSLKGYYGAVELHEHNLRFGSDNTDATYRGTITGSGMLKKFGTGAQILTGDLAYTGDTEVQNGSLILEGNNESMTGDILVKSGATLRAYNGKAVSSASRVTLESSATFTVLNDENIGSLAGSGTVNTNNSTARTLGVGQDNSDSTFSGVIAGAGGKLTKLGTGTLTLTGNNTYTGKTTISEGTLALSGEDILAGNSIEIQNGATLQTDHRNSLPGSANVSIAAGGVLDLPAGVEITSFTGEGLIRGHEQILVAGGEDSSFTFNGTLNQVNLTKQGTGTLTIAGERTQGFNATVEAGTLRFEQWDRESIGTIAIQSGASVESIYDGIGRYNEVVVAAGGSLLLEGDEHIGTLSGAGSVYLPAQASDPLDPLLPHAQTGLAVCTNDSTKTVTFSGEISGEGYFFKQGTHTMIMDSANSYTGGTILAYGCIVADHDQVFGSGDIFFDGGELQINEGVTIRNKVDFTNFVGGGILCGNGTLQTDLLAAAETFIAPGKHSLLYEDSIGLFTVDGNFTQAEGGLFMELGGPDAGEYDRLVITGKADLSGMLYVKLLEGYILNEGDSFDLLNWGSITAESSFDEIILPTLGGGMQWSTSRLYTDGVISVVPEPASMAVLLLGFAGLARRRRFGRTV